MSRVNTDFWAADRLRALSVLSPSPFWLGLLFLAAAAPDPGIKKACQVMAGCLNKGDLKLV